MIGLCTNCTGYGPSQQASSEPELTVPLDEESTWALLADFSRNAASRGHGVKLRSGTFVPVLVAVVSRPAT
jgi:hypothetical protein